MAAAPLRKIFLFVTPKLLDEYEYEYEDEGNKDLLLLLLLQHKEKWEDTDFCVVGLLIRANGIGSLSVKEECGLKEDRERRNNVEGTEDAVDDAICRL